MFTGFLIAITIVCFLLILAIMVQNPKGGGLSSSFGGGANQLGGVQKTTDFLDKSTWTLGGILIALILLSSLAFDSETSGSRVLSNDDMNTLPQTEIPTTPQAQQQATEQAAEQTPASSTEEAAQ